MTFCESRSPENKLTLLPHEKVKRTAENIAEASGATAEVYIGSDTGYATTTNDPELTAAMAHIFDRVAGKK